MYTVQCDVLSPFSWLNNDAWEYISNVIDGAKYAELDDICRYLIGEMDKSDFLYYNPNSTIKRVKLCQRYNEEFPKQMAQTMRVLADLIEQGDIKFQFTFTNTAKIDTQEDKFSQRYTPHK